MTDEAELMIPAHVDRAADRASEDDRAWFAARPTRRWRLRDQHRFEVPGDDGAWQPPEGWSRRVIVIQHAPGYRQRCPCLAPEDCPNSGEIDEPPEAAISQMFWRHAPSEERKVARQWGRHVRKLEARA